MRRAARLALPIAALAVATAARAQVFEIGADGAMLRAGQTSGEDVPALADNLAGDGEGPLLPDVAVTVGQVSSAPAAFRGALSEAAAKYDVSTDLLAALVWQESRWRPGAVSVKGAVGLAQLMPATARALAVDPRDSSANLMGAARYLRQMLDLFDGDIERALAAYNAGPARVLKANGVPPISETRRYVATIIDRLSPVPTGASQ